MSQMRRVIQRRNNLSDTDSEAVENVLRAYADRRLSDQEAARQLRGYVPNQAGLDLDDLLPIVLALLSGRQGQGGVSDLIGSFLGGQQNQSSPTSGGGLGDMIGALLGGGQDTQYTNQPSTRNIDLHDLIGTFLNREQPVPRQQRPTQQGGGIVDLLDDLLAGDDDNTQYRASTSRETSNDHNLRKRR